MPSDSPSPSATTVDANLLTRLDRAPVTRTLRVGISVVVLVWLLESFDIGLVSVLILVLGPHWDLSSGQIGLLGASGTIGLLAGMLPAGRLADLYGRKKVLLVGTAVFAVFTLLSAFSTNFALLIVLRILAGLGEGAIFPVPYLMISELVNKEARGRIMGYAQWVLNGGYTLPALVGLWAVSTFDTEWSWRVPCLIGGLPLLLVPVLAKWVPESPRFQLRKAARQGSTRARDDVRKLVTQIEDEAGIATTTRSSTRDPGSLDETRSMSRCGCATAGGAYLRRSLIAYAALTSSFIVWYTMLTYAPKIYGMLGATKSNSLLYTGVMMFVSAFGVFYQGKLADSEGESWSSLCTCWSRRRSDPAHARAGRRDRGRRHRRTRDAWFGLGSFSIPKMYMAEQYPTGCAVWGPVSAR